VTRHYWDGVDEIVSHRARPVRNIPTRDPEGQLVIAVLLAAGVLLVLALPIILPGS